MKGNDYSKKLKKIYLYGVYLAKYYYNVCKKSVYFQSLLSKIYGLSIAHEMEKSIYLEYLYNGEKYIVYLPFERRNVNKMLNNVVQVNYENKSEVIHQQPGVPFLITPKHIGAKSATIFTIEAEKQILENEKIE